MDLEEWKRKGFWGGFLLYHCKKVFFGYLETVLYFGVMLLHLREMFIILRLSLLGCALLH